MIANGLIDVNRYHLTFWGGRCFREAFQTEQYVRLPSFMTFNGLQLLLAEAKRLESQAVRKEFLMECMGNTPRRMSTIGADIIADNSALLPALYRDPGILEFVSGVYGRNVEVVPDPVECFVLNYLSESGDTHGGHFDDYPVALILILEAPTGNKGGLLEFLPDAEKVEELAGDNSRRAAHRPGDAYLLKTDTAAHRVTPLRCTARRTVINMAYGGVGERRHTTASASLLYSR